MLEVEGPRYVITVQVKLVAAARAEPVKLALSSSLRGPDSQHS
jgi:hypothetical protein